MIAQAHVSQRMKEKVCLGCVGSIDGEHLPLVAVDAKARPYANLVKSAPLSLF